MNTEKILVVDDERFNCALIRELCEGIGYTVVEASTASSALEQTIRLQPDLILLDILLEEKSGFEVCREIRANPSISGIPIIIVTTLNDSASIVRSLEAGADDYVTKPFHVLELQTRIRSVLDAYHYRRQLSGKRPQGRRLRGYQQLREDLDYEFQRAQRYRHPLSLVFFDLDTSCSTQLEEAPAQAWADSDVADVLRKSLRSVDLIYRLSAEQFVLLLPETPAPGSKVAIQRIREKFESEEPPHTACSFTASLVTYPHRNLKSSQDLLQAASSLLKRTAWDEDQRLIEFDPNA
jgi:diguanylate cyclase (GGDEF)-like protein